MHTLRRIFRRRPIRMGLVEDSGRRSTPIRNAGFVSFFNGSACVSRRNTDSYDARLRRQRFVKTLVVIAVSAMCTWFVMESAQAISTF